MGWTRDHGVQVDQRRGVQGGTEKAAVWGLRWTREDGVQVDQRRGVQVDQRRGLTCVFVLVRASAT